ncbi:tRNA (adenosine(37)-N6)-dimethylallyltransferase MiaA [Patescibacteria group bacterium]
MKKILYIVGSTATGKTSLGIKLATKFGAELISADSKQIYKDMDIGSGKDIPKKASKKTSSQNLTYYQIKKTKIWGYDLADPSQEYSVSHYKKFADSLIKDIHSRNKLPIIVGGSGFYLKCIENPPNSLRVTQNKTLRQKLNKLTTNELQERLKNLNKERFNQMNNSDVNNPRRLIRAIEIKLSDTTKEKSASEKYNSLWIGLNVAKNEINISIKKRVLKRLEDGFEKEFEDLSSSKKLLPNTQASSSMGYKHWFEYKKGETTKEEAIKKWTTAEQQYANRQKTWFKKQKEIFWFDAKDENSQKSIVQMIKNWYA